MNTPHGSPAARIRRTRSSRARGVGVPGSRVACRSGSNNARETPSPTDTDEPAAVEQLQVPGQHGALGQDRERRATVCQCANDVRHQSVPSLGPLVRVGVGAHCDVFAVPLRGRNLFAQHGSDVDLDDDLGVEVATGVELQVGVGVPGEAVDAAMRTPSIRVDRPAERHRRIPRHLVQRRFAVHLVEGHAGELRRPDRADEPGEPAHARARQTGPRPPVPALPISFHHPNICSTEIQLSAPRGQHFCRISNRTDETGR